MRKLLGRLILIGALAGGVVAARNYLRGSSAEEVVQLVFDDGSTRSLASNTVEAQEFTDIARKIVEIGISSRPLVDTKLRSALHSGVGSRGCRAPNGKGKRRARAVGRVSGHATCTSSTVSGSRLLDRPGVAGEGRQPDGHG